MLINLGVLFTSCQVPLSLKVFSLTRGRFLLLLAFQYHLLPSVTAQWTTGKFLTWRQYILSCSTAVKAERQARVLGLFIHGDLCGFAFYPVHYQTQAKGCEVPWPETVCLASESLGGTSDTVRDWTAGDGWLKHLTTCSNHTGAGRDWIISANGSNNWLGALLETHRVTSGCRRAWGYKLGFQIREKAEKRQMLPGEINPSSHASVLSHVTTQLWKLPSQVLGHSLAGWRIHLGWWAMTASTTLTRDSSSV